MNERISELAAWATEYASERDMTGEYVIAFNQDMYNEKFAKLLIRECAGIYSKIDNGNLHMGTDNYLEALQKHFGVES